MFTNYYKKFCCLKPEKFEDSTVIIWQIFFDLSLIYLERLESWNCLFFPSKKENNYLLSDCWKNYWELVWKKKDVSVCPSCSAISKTEVSLFLFSKWFDERVQQIFFVIFKIEKTSNITLVLFMNKYHHFWLNFVLILNSEKLEPLQLFSFIITLFFE